MPMHFHRGRQTEALREGRLIFQQGGEVPQQPTPEQLQKTIKEMVDTRQLTPHAQLEASRAHIEAANKNTEEARANVQNALTNTARIYVHNRHDAGANAADIQADVTRVFGRIAGFRIDAAPDGSSPPTVAFEHFNNPSASAEARNPMAELDAFLGRASAFVPETDRKEFRSLVASMDRPGQIAMVDALGGLEANPALLVRLASLPPGVNVRSLLDPARATNREATQKFIASLPEPERKALTTLQNALQNGFSAMRGEISSEQQKKMIEDARKQVVEQPELRNREPRTLTEEDRNLIAGRIMMRTGVAIEWNPQRNDFDYTAPGGNFDAIMNRVAGLFLIFSAYKGKFEVATGQRPRNSTTTAPGTSPETAGETTEKRVAAINSNPLNRYVRLVRQTVEGRTNILIQADRQPSAPARAAGQTFDEATTKALASVSITVPAGVQEVRYENVDNVSMQTLENVLQTIFKAGAESTIKTTTESILKLSGGTFTEQDQKAITAALHTPGTWVDTTGRPGGEYGFIAVSDKIYVQSANGTICLELSANRAPVLHNNRFFNAQSGQLENKPEAARLPRYNAVSRLWEASTEAQIKQQDEQRRKLGGDILRGTPSMTPKNDGALFEYDADGLMEYYFRYNPFDHSWEWQYGDDTQWNNINTIPVNHRRNNPTLHENEIGYPNAYANGLPFTGESTDAGVNSIGVRQAREIIEQLRKICNAPLAAG